MTAVFMNTSGIGPGTMTIPGPSVDTKTGSADFAGIMNDKMSKSSENAVKQEQPGSISNKKTNSTGAVNEQVNGNPDAADKKVSDEKSISENTGAVTTDDDNINAEEAAAVLAAMGNIVEGVAGILNITTNELNDAMNALSLTPADLTDKGSLAQLVLFVNGSNDMADMLVDNGMLETFNSLMNFVSGEIEKSGADESLFAKILNSGDGVLSQEPVKQAMDKIPEDIRKFFETDAAADGGQSTGIAEGGPVITVTGEAGGAEAEENPEGFFTGDDDTSGTAHEGIVSTGIRTDDFIAGLEKAAGEQEIAENVDFGQIVRQVVDSIKINVSPENTSMEMRLNPDNLGRVSVNIVSKNGVMTAEINTENEAAREAIESQLQILKENIAQRGITVEEIEVKLSDFHFADSSNAQSGEGGNENRGNGRHGNGGTVDDTQDFTIEPQTAREIVESEETTVNYRV